MHHYIYAMHSNGVPPVGDGNIKAWFEYYKLGNGPGTSIPFFEKDMPEEERAAAGDYLWFSMDNVLVGVCRVTGIEPDPLNKRVDVFYDSSKVVPLSVTVADQMTCGRAADAGLGGLTALLAGLAIDR